MWLVVPGETFVGLPTADAFHAITRGLGDARRDFGVAVAPTKITPGFTMACVFAATLFAVIADWGAFHVGATIEATVPAFTVFVFAAVLGTKDGRVPATLAFVGAMLIWFTAHNATVVARTKPWFTGTMARGRRALARGGVGLGVVALVGAGLGMALPFTQDPPAVAWRNHGQSHARTTVSPLVDIRTRLVSRSDVIAFTVEAKIRSYWRLTSLDLFDGRIWSSQGSYKDVDPSKRFEGRSGTLSKQNFTIANLASIWLPVAYQPTGAPSLAGTSYDEDADAFITDNENSNDLEYSVLSVVRSPTAETLRAAKPAKVDKSQLALPAGVDPRVVALAAQVTRGAATPYDKAFAIQQLFRGGQFTYDLSVAPGHGEDDIVRFLFSTKRGYCEQFAGTYAVLARLAGLPTRVAVGFTAGDPDPATGRLVVRELNAHAWPEVFLGSAGWVAFEPTPGRGIPGSQAYTGTAESQADSTTPGATSTVVPTTAVGAGGAEGGAATTTTAPARGASSEPEHRNVWIRVALIALGLLVLLGAIASIVPVIIALRRRRRWAAAQDAAARVLVAWDDTVDALRFAGTPARLSDTPAERVAAVGSSIDASGVATLERLATRVDLASYAPDPGLTNTDAEKSRVEAVSVRRAALATRSWQRRVVYLVNPRRLRRRG
jgi:transglutaminase-like putative cysteine protease